MLRSEHGGICEILGNALIGRPFEHSQHATCQSWLQIALSGVFFALEVASNHHAKQRNRHTTRHIDRIRQLRQRLANVVLRHAVFIAHIQLIVSFIHAEFRDAEVSPAPRLRREIAHPRHDAVEIAVVHPTPRSVIQIHHIIEVRQLPIHPGVRQFEELRVGRSHWILNALQRGQRQKEPEILGED